MGEEQDMPSRSFADAYVSRQVRISVTSRRRMASLRVSLQRRQLRLGEQLRMGRSSTSMALPTDFDGSEGTFRPYTGCDPAAQAEALQGLEPPL